MGTDFSPKRTHNRISHEERFDFRGPQENRMSFSLNGLDIIKKNSNTHIAEGGEV